MWKCSLLQFVRPFPILALLLVSGPALSQGADEQAPEPTRIEADNEAGVIRFIVKGETKAVLADDGLHVRDNISYGQVITDYGTVNFDRLFRKPEEDGDAR